MNSSNQINTNFGEESDQNQMYKSNLLSNNVITNNNNLSNNNNMINLNENNNNNRDNERFPKQYKEENKKEEIGKGGFGHVFKYKINEKEDAAVKIINKKKGNFNLEEINTMKRFSDKENIIKIINFDEDENNYYIIMELCDCDLKDYLENIKETLNINLIQTL